jgi:hypothetical protein
MVRKFPAGCVLADEAVWVDSRLHAEAKRPDHLEAGRLDNPVRVVRARLHVHDAGHGARPTGRRAPSPGRPAASSSPPQRRTRRRGARRCTANAAPAPSRDRRGGRRRVHGRALYPQQCAHHLPGPTRPRRAGHPTPAGTPAERSNPEPLSHDHVHAYLQTRSAAAPAERRARQHTGCRAHAAGQKFLTSAPKVSAIQLPPVHLLNQRPATCRWRVQVGAALREARFDPATVAAAMGAHHRGASVSHTFARIRPLRTT